MTDPRGRHSECAPLLVRQMAADGIEVTASDWRPGMVMPPGLTELAMVCPHGIQMWMEPTPEQRLAWAQEATRD